MLDDGLGSPERRAARRAGQFAEDATPGSRGHGPGCGLSASGLQAVHKQMGKRTTQQQNKAATVARNFVVVEDTI